MSVGVLDLLPHRPPMVVVQDVLEVEPEEGTARCLCMVTEDSPLVDQGSVPQMLVVEMLAQSAACLKGTIELLKGEPVKPAYLVRIDDLTIPTVLKPGESVAVSTRALRGLGDYFIYEAEASVARGLLAKGTLRFIVDRQA